MKKLNKNILLNESETLSIPNKIKSEGIVYEDGYKKIEKITAKFDDFNKEYFVSDFGEKSALLASCNDHILLTRQYRLLINDLSYEIPGGKVNNDEVAEEAAIRECYEETGLLFNNLEPLITYDPDLEYTKNRTHVFFVNDSRNIYNRNSKKYEWLPYKKCIEMINKRVIMDSLSIIAILAFSLKAKIKT